MYTNVHDGLFFYFFFRLFDWRPEPMRGARFKREKTVVLQNMFEPKEFDVSKQLSS